MSDFRLTSPVPVGGREDNDHYPTPRWCVLALLRGGLWWPSGPSVLDPSCGEGAILQAVHEEIPDTNAWGIELDPGRFRAAEEAHLQVVQGDGLEVEWGSPDLVIGNPPYRLASEFAWKAAEWAAEGRQRRACLLLRLSFLEPASGRGQLLRLYPPDVLILPRRPAFDGRGTDSITSAWFCWPGKGQLVWL